MRVNDGLELDESQLDPGIRLIDVLREQLGLTGTKEACGRGECGACTVLVDGRPVLACITLARRVSGEVHTIEGLAEEGEALRVAFARRAAFQCGFCTPGQIVRGVSLLRSGVPQDERSLREAIVGNVCRCTGYAGVLDALRDASDGSESRSEEHMSDHQPHHQAMWKEHAR